MDRTNPLSAYALPVLLILLLLKFLGVIDITIFEILSYIFIFIGAGTVYRSLGKGSKVAIFAGTVIFLVGIIFFLSTNFEFPDLKGLILPSFLFIIGAAFFMLFIDETSSTILLIISAAFIITGIAFTVLLGAIEIGSFFSAIWAVTRRYWIILIIVIVAALLLQRK